MTGFDTFALVVIGVLGTRSLLRGFFKELGSLAGIVGGVILARMFSGVVAGILKSFVKYEFAAQALAFAVICVVVGIAASVLTSTMAALVRKTGLGIMDRLGGFAVGALQGTILVGVVLLVGTAVSGGLLEKSFAAGSMFAPPILAFMKMLSGVVFTGAAKVKAASLITVAILKV